MKRTLFIVTLALLAPTFVSAVAAELPEIKLWPRGMPEPIVPADPPEKIGVLGFSAGGQITLIAATNAGFFPDEPGGASPHPDFLLLIYPYNIYDPATQALRVDIHSDADLPPTFIAQAADDTASLPQGSALLYLELLNRKIPGELHIYEKGGHGFGMRARPGATGPTDWPQRAVEWLRLRGFATALK